VAAPERGWLFYRTLLENSFEGIAIVDAEGVITFQNRAAAQILGAEEGELIGTRATDLIHPEDLAQAMSSLATLNSNQGMLLPDEVRMKRRNDGEWVYLETRAVNLSENPEVRGIVVNFRDVTKLHAVLRALRLSERDIREHNAALEAEIAERRRVEAERELLITELEDRNAELERFTYTVSHELKNPLVTIVGFLGMLRQDLRDGDEARIAKDAEKIAGAVSQMDRLLDELLELSRVGRVANPPEEVAFGTLVEEALGRVDSQISETGAVVEVASGLPVVSVDRTRMVEVLQNLLDNALKFRRDGSSPRIGIGVVEAGGSPVFYVRDDGIGVEPEYRERVFQLFEQLTRDGRGSGIGLTLARRIVEVHGGRLWVESEGRNRGCTFCFTLGRAR